MRFCDYASASAEVKKQINDVVSAWRARLGDALVGAYLQGSMSLGQFVEGVSDIDLLFVVSRRIPREERLLLAGDMIALDYKPSTIEMSALWADDLKNWRYPTPCQFHYSNSWTERYKQMIDGSMPQCFIIDEDFEDADIACHARLARERGVCLYGAPVGEAIPPVPEKDFLSSLMYDFGDGGLEDDDLPNGVLSRARVLSYIVEKRIMTKRDAALWAIPRVPPYAADMLRDALASKFEGKPFPKRSQAQLQAFGEYFANEIRANS